MSYTDWKVLRVQKLLFCRAKEFYMEKGTPCVRIESDGREPSCWHPKPYCVLNIGQVYP